MQKLLMSACLLLSATAWAQSAPSTLTTTTRLVIVPTMVNAPEGSVVHTLQASDFHLTDNGVAQKVSLESAERQPLSVVVLMQTGGAAPRQFAAYSHLQTMLDSLVDSAPHRVAMVTFDSQPVDQWDFTANVEDLSDGFTHPVAGDDGAAVYDAVGYGIDLLKQQPSNSRRILILLSQTQDHGSRSRVDEIVRRLGENNVTIYSIAFSPETTWLKDQFTKPRHANAPYVVPGYGAIGCTFDLGTPLGMAIRAMQTNAASEVAALSGGEYVSFSSRRELEEQFSVLANHIPNRYMLSFRPSSDTAGLHTLQVGIPSHPELGIAARTSYWTEAAPAP